MGRNFLYGMLIGMAVGAAAGLLLAPRPGAEMRGQLAERSKEAAGRIGRAAARAVGRTAPEEEAKQAI